MTRIIMPITQKGQFGDNSGIIRNTSGRKIILMAFRQPGVYLGSVIGFKSQFILLNGRCCYS